MGNQGERGEGIPMVVSDVDREVLRSVPIGKRLNVWTKPDLDYMNVYAPGSLGGFGRVFRLVKDDNPRIAARMAAGRTVWVMLTAIEDGRYKLEAFADD